MPSKKQSGPGRQTLGPRYQVIDLVGEGAAADVYSVRDAHDGSVKAAKVLKPASVESEQTLSRFEDEYRILRGLHHPSLPEVYDYGFTGDDSRYMVMELVEGQTLDRYIGDHPQDLWVTLYQLCEALTFVHTRDLLHHDIKPSNVLVRRTRAFGDEMPLVTLMDFGLTYRRGKGMKVAMVGTPEYMAPEIIRGETPLTRAVDYYSLGVTLYELIEGRVPFSGSMKDVLSAHLEARPSVKKERLEYAELYPHIWALMSKDRKERLDAYENFTTAIEGRLAGGVDVLDQAYAMSHIDSIGRIGKGAVWERIREWLESVQPATPQASPGLLAISGPGGSGKTYCVDRVRDAAAVRGIQTWRFGQASEFAGLIKPAASEFSHAWDAILAAANNTGTVLFIDSCENLSTEEFEFIRYAGKRIEIEKSEGNQPRIAFMITDVDLDEDRFAALQLPVDFAAPCAIPPLQAGDYEEVLSTFRGRLDSSETRNRLLEDISSVGSTAGSVVASLRNAVAEKNLTFRHGRWQLQPLGLGHVEGDAAVDDTSYLLSLMDDMDRCDVDILRWMAVNDTRLPLDILRDVCQVGQPLLQDAIARLAQRRIVRTGHDQNGQYVDFESGPMRSTLYGAIAEDDRRSRHQRLLQLALQKYKDETDDLSLSDTVATHYHQLDQHDDYLRVQLRSIIHHAGRDDAAGLRRVCRATLNALEHTPATKRDPYLMRRFVLREWIRFERRHGNYEHLVDLYQRQFIDPNRPLPLSFTKYVSHSLSQSGKDVEAMALLENALDTVNAEQSQMHNELLIAKARVLNAQGKNREAGQVVSLVAQHLDLLGPYDLCRYHVESAIAYEGQGEPEMSEKHGALVEEQSRKYRYPEELCISFLLRANQEFDAGRYRDATRYLRLAVHAATRNKRRFKLAEAYFLASGVYYEEGDFDRALRFLSRANEVAVNAGKIQSVMVYAVRFAMISQNVGRYGDAVRFVRKVTNAPSSRLDGVTAALAELLEVDMAIVLGSTDVEAKLRRAEETVDDKGKEYHKAYFHLLRGDHYMRAGRVKHAEQSYSIAASLSEKVGFADDAVRAAIRIGYVYIEQNRNNMLAAIEDIRRRALELESQGFMSEYLTLELAAKYAFGVERHDIVQSAASCAEAELITREVPTRMEMNKLLFRVYANLGMGEEARNHFQRFYESLRRVLSNLGEEFNQKTYMKVSGAAMVLDEYRLHFGSITKKKGAAN